MKRRRYSARKEQDLFDAAREITGRRVDSLRRAKQIVRRWMGQHKSWGWMVSHHAGEDGWITDPCLYGLRGAKAEVERLRQLRRQRPTLALHGVFGVAMDRRHWFALIPEPADIRDQRRDALLFGDLEM